MIEGLKDPLRREALEKDAGILHEDGWRQYAKKSTIFAKQMVKAFKVKTLEGTHIGKAGDYLAVGVAGEMYPIDAEVFVDSYDEVTDKAGQAGQIEMFPDNEPANDVPGAFDTDNPNTPSEAM